LSFTSEKKNEKSADKLKTENGKINEIVMAKTQGKWREKWGKAMPE